MNLFVKIRPQELMDAIKVSSQSLVLVPLQYDTTARLCCAHRGLPD